MIDKKREVGALWVYQELLFRCCIGIVGAFGICCEGGSFVCVFVLFLQVSRGVADSWLARRSEAA